MAVWLPAVPAPDPVPTLTTVEADLAGLRAVRRTGQPGSLAGLCVSTHADGPAVLTASSWPEETPLIRAIARDDAGRGATRNAALARLDRDADYVAVLDGGDEVFGDTLGRLAGMLDVDPDLDAVLCLASIGTDELANALVPELRRLESRAYLSRGYVVRREVLEALGGFTEDPTLEELVDHHFWLGLMRSGGRVALARHIGVRLWPREQESE